MSLSNSQEDAEAERPFKACRLKLVPASETVYKTESQTGGGFIELISTGNLIAVDKTQYIEALDSQQVYRYMFLRPRSWGKTTFLQTLINYYDKGMENRFQELFGDLYIGRNPTTARNSLLVLRFDFSSISSGTSVEETKDTFNEAINTELSRFLQRYQAFLGGDHSNLLKSNATTSLRNVLNLVDSKGERLFVGVDEYDAPANWVILNESKQDYQDITTFFRARFFSLMKQFSHVISKYWVTGILPVFREDISPLNTTQIISDMPGYSGLCGLTDIEVRQITQSYLSSYNEHQIEAAIKRMKKWYNGYVFKGERHGSKETVICLHNPYLVFCHLRALADDRLSAAILEEIGAPHVSSILGRIPDTGDQSFFHSWLQIVSKKMDLKVTHHFGIDEIRNRNQNSTVIWSLLYYFGVLAYDEQRRYLRVPNLTMLHTVTRSFAQFLDRRFIVKPRGDGVHISLMQRDVAPLVKLLEGLFKDEQARAIKDFNETALQMTLSALWSNSTPCIELKTITLENLWRGENESLPLDSDVPLQQFRQKLRDETEEQLLERRIFYNKAIKSLREVKQEAFEQITRYLNVMRNGQASSNRPGVNDTRIKQSEGVGQFLGPGEIPSIPRSYSRSMKRIAPCGTNVGELDDNIIWHSSEIIYEGIFQVEMKDTYGAE
ncbi:17517_t:CDS:2 [Acaulospora colombiana]|uniref:17517_t:CDS:1 n=1 Tax=Acaulospora colombiana TaxID=27376 RepID=A0ACA9NGU5_9GLOM|nr:17517_t:CDS:2 [Acaulospora colombiana]